METAYQSRQILAGDDYSEKDFPGTVRAVKEAFLRSPSTAPRGGTSRSAAPIVRATRAGRI